MDKKRPYTFLFRKGADQTVASPGAKPVAKSGKRGPAKKAAMRSIGIESKAKPAAGTSSAVAVAT